MPGHPEPERRGVLGGLVLTLLLLMVTQSPAASQQGCAFEDVCPSSETRLSGAPSRVCEHVWDLDRSSPELRRRRAPVKLKDLGKEARPAFGYLLRVFNDPGEAVSLRTQAVGALARIGPPDDEALGKCALREFRDYVETYTRRRWGTEKEGVEAEPGATSERQLFEGTVGALGCLARQSPRDWPEVGAICQADSIPFDWPEIGESASALVEMIQAGLHHEQKRGVRASFAEIRPAWEALGMIGPGVVRDEKKGKELGEQSIKLAKGAEGASPEYRSVVVQALGLIFSDANALSKAEAAQQIRNMLDYELARGDNGSESVLIAEVRAIGRVGYDDGLIAKILVEILNGRYGSEVVKSTIRTLGEIRATDEVAVRRLDLMVKEDQREGVLIAVGRALAEICVTTEADCREVLISIKDRMGDPTLSSVAKNILATTALAIDRTIRAKSKFPNLSPWTIASDILNKVIALAGLAILWIFIRKLEWRFEVIAGHVAGALFALTLLVVGFVAIFALDRGSGQPIIHPYVLTGFGSMAITYSLWVFLKSGRSSSGGATAAGSGQQLREADISSQ